MKQNGTRIIHIRIPFIRVCFSFSFFATSDITRAQTEYRINGQIDRQGKKIIIIIIIYFAQQYKTAVEISTRSEQDSKALVERQ